MNKKTRNIIIVGAIAAICIAGIIMFNNRKITVTFDSAGGTQVAAVKVGVGKYVRKPTTPKRDGYEFLGWFVDDMPYDFTVRVTKPITLTAKWEKLEYVLFMVNDEEYANERRYEGNVWFPNDPVVIKKAFIGWFNEKGEAVTQYSYNGEDVLYARFVDSIPAVKIRFEKDIYEIEQWKSETLKLIGEPDQWSENYSFISADPAIATVENTNELYAYGIGRTRITVITESGIVGECEVVVTLPVEDLEFAEKEIRMKKNQNYQLELKVWPEQHSDTIMFSSSDDSIVSVDASGVLHSHGVGTAVITAKTEKAAAEVTVIVTNEAVDIAVPQQIDVESGQTVRLGATLLPEDTVSTLSYMSSNEDIARIDSEGNITGVTAGHCTITVRSSNGLLKQVHVYVTEYILSISIDYDYLFEHCHFYDDRVVRLYYDRENRPVLKPIAEVIIKSQNGEAVIPVDYRKLKMITSNDLLVYDSSINEMHVSEKAALSEGFTRWQKAVIYFTYEYEGRVLTSY
ncbi:MAG: Ig-like domain-containing protein, partial [Erysipelotrichaceae bacterium]|nr:Ig-like domain-containing protein [Erysipelotrichaceae bacterium]